MVRRETITIKMPESCWNCNHKDAESGGCCELMPGDPFETYSEQYENCPIWKLYDYYKSESAVNR